VPAGRKAVWKKVGQTNSSRVVRGGSWNNNTRNVRVSNRNNNNPTERNNNVGFRVAQYSIGRGLVPAFFGVPFSRYALPEPAGAWLFPSGVQTTVQRLSPSRMSGTKASASGGAASQEVVPLF